MLIAQVVLHQPSRLPLTDDRARLEAAKARPQPEIVKSQISKGKR